MTSGVDQTRRPNVVVRGLTKSYQSRRRTHVALDNIDVEVGGGDLVVLLGPSGCGKTTLLRCIAGLEIPDRGDILINDRLVFSAEKCVNIPPESRNLGMVFQSYALWPNMSVFENVGYPLRCGLRLAANEVERRVREALHRVGLEMHADNYPGQLSGGQQQRVSLARALVADRGLLLFDEPLSNLDAKVRERLRIELLALQRDVGFTGIYVTHDQIEALALADRIAVMDVGHMAQIGTPYDVYTRPHSRYVAHFVGNANEFTGKIVGVDGERYEVTTALGTLHANSSGEALPVGQNAAVIVRPENCRLSEESDATAIACVVKESMFLGSHVQYVLEAGGQTFSAVEHGASPRSATALFVTFDPARTLVFPTGQAI
ncbi:MAG: ABC transporter ATP-binding protein [Xanthobacteraceae bacterium]